MAVSLRFYVQQLTKHAGFEHVTVKLAPAYAQGANADWASATPSGSMELNVNNPAAIEQFEKWLDDRTNLHITMAPVEAEPSA